MWSKAIVIAVCCAQFPLYCLSEEVQSQPVDVAVEQPAASDPGSSKLKGIQKPVRGKPSTEELRLARQKQKEARGKAKPKTEAELQEMRERIAQMRSATAKPRPPRTPPGGGKEKSKKSKRNRWTTTGAPGTTVSPPGDRPPPSQRNRWAESQRGKPGSWLTSTRPDGAAAPPKPKWPTKPRANKAKKDKANKIKKEWPKPDTAAWHKKMEQWKENAMKIKEGGMAKGPPSKRPRERKRGQGRAATDLLSDRQRRAGDASPGAQPAEL